MDSGLFLKTITLRNFATFENQDIKFHPNFNGIIGETGSGKSLILDAFQLLLGARSDKKLIRKDTECAIVEGVFKVNNSNIRKFFDQEGFPIDEDNEVVIKRILYQNGKSKAFLNHMNCPLSSLTNFSKTFVDLVGQFENQKLGNAEYQLYLVDQFANNVKSLQGYQKIFEEYQKLIQDSLVLELQISEKQQREDYLKFQLKELQGLSPSVEREEELIALKSRLLNKEEHSKVLSDIQDAVCNGDSNALDHLKYIEKTLNNAHGLFESKFIEDFSNLISSFEDFAYEVSRKEVSADEEFQLDTILEELDRYQKLKRKFNIGTAELSNLKKQFEDELSGLEKLEAQLTTLKKKLSSFEDQLYTLANELHENRRRESAKMSKLITNGLDQLNMAGASFKIDIRKTQTLTKNGLTSLSFMAETNPGEGFYKIKDIASGGELSRILLCLRQIVAAEDSISIFFFDEIDTGIGGETAQMIAKALKKVSQKSQVLAITHLAQIAKAVDEIIFVDKKSFESENNVRTISFVENKKGDARERVINQLAGL
ncbi:MAG: AAA family ATPase [Bacteriovoracaceae bacterium]|nr:AAA family ATPase [Bacteriovoracaceae bacterium]